MALSNKNRPFHICEVVCFPHPFAGLCMVYMIKVCFVKGQQAVHVIF